MDELIIRIGKFIVAREEADGPVPESGELHTALNETRGPDDYEVSLTIVCRTLRAMQARGLVKLFETYGATVREDLAVMSEDRLYGYLATH